jgi:3-methyladenine DNA glycosylase AlkC
MAALKDLYDKQFIASLSAILNKSVSQFDEATFTKSIFDKNWKQLELKQRMRHITLMLHQVLPADFKKAAPVLQKITTTVHKQHGEGMMFLYMFLPDYVEQFGIDYLDVSIPLIEQITQVTSAEFAVRPFIIKYPQPMMKQMLKWSKHSNEFVRRLSTEGCRPRLPWAIALPAFKNDPTPVLSILENLKNDPSETVRRSVANNLNDIAKDHPDIVLQLIKKWKGISENTDWVIKHGFRTLLKKGNAEAMQHFGNHKIPTAAVTDLKCNKKITIGESLTFEFKLHHQEKKAVQMRLDYAIYYMKSNGKQSKKVFRMNDGLFEKNKHYPFIKKQHFKDLTTRKHYPGAHKLAIIINGTEHAHVTFQLI